MNVRVLALKTKKFSDFLRPVSNLFHSFVVGGK